MRSKVFCSEVTSFLFLLLPPSSCFFFFLLFFFLFFFSSSSFFFFFFPRRYNFKEVLSFSTNVFHSVRSLMQSFQFVIFILVMSLFTSSGLSPSSSPPPPSSSFWGATTSEKFWPSQRMSSIWSGLWCSPSSLLFSSLLCRSLHHPVSHLLLPLLLLLLLLLLSERYNFKEVLAFSTNVFRSVRSLMQSFQFVISILVMSLFTSSSHLFI